MNNQLKVWLGVGTYLLTATGAAVPPSELTASAPIGNPLAIAAAQAVERDPCRLGLGGEGGEGSEGGESGEAAPIVPNPAVNPSELKQAVAQYKVYVLDQVDLLIASTKDFTDKVVAGNLPAAKAAYAPSRISWERIEPVAEKFAAFDTSVDARIDDFKGEDDPEFMGFHRIELGLFKYNTTKGLQPFAKRLMADVTGLKQCVVSLEIEPRDMVRGAAELIEEVAQSKITGEEDRYSGTDFWSFNANVEGSIKIVDLLRPILQKVEPKLLQEINTGFAEVNGYLAKYRLPNGGFATYDKLTPADKRMLQASLARLAEDLAKLRGVIGV